MTTRRKFLQLSATAAAAGCILRESALAQTAAAKTGEGITYGVQMFMVREQAATDLAAAFRTIHDGGFSQVELYPIAYKRPAAELRNILTDSGLSSVSGHFDYTGRDASVDYAHQLGLKYLVCPMLPKDQWNSLDGFRKAADWFNKWAETAHSAGIQFVFHNHDYEFKPIDGSFGFAELMKNTSPKLVKLELDVYWLTQGGQDPAAILRKYADRAVLLHMKDRIANAPTTYTMDPPQPFTELGQGSIPFPALLKQAKQQGIHYAYLDQDDTRMPIPQSMKISHDYLQTLHI